MKKSNHFTFKALSRISLVLILTLSFSTFLLAQQMQLIHPANPNANLKSSNSSVLYSQNNLDSNGRPSQDFEAGFDGYDSQGADDFVVPTVGWDITEIEVFGSGAGPFDLVHVHFYNDLAGTPDATAFTSFMNVATVVDNAGALYVTLPGGGVSLAAGTYWFTVEDATPYATAGQWFWTMSADVYNAHANWRNPNDGFGTGAVTWTSLQTIWGDDKDFAFVLYGNSGAPAVPIGNWPIFLGFFLIIATVAIRFRKKLA